MPTAKFSEQHVKDSHLALSLAGKKCFRWHNIQYNHRVTFSTKSDQYRQLADLVDPSIYKH